jgi:3-hydroxyacyl-[acyl-carrier-protein] dehydratase
MTSPEPPVQIRPLKSVKAVNGKTLPLRAEDLQEILPHRGAFALIDRVEEIDAGKRAIGRHLVTRNDPLLDGHFPGRPIVPGVLLIEALAQLAGIVLWSGRELAVPTGGDGMDAPAGGPPLGVLAGVKKFRVLRLVVPGDLVRLAATSTARLGGVSEFHVVAHVDRETAAEGVLQLGFRP